MKKNGVLVQLNVTTRDKTEDIVRGMKNIAEANSLFFTHSPQAAAPRSVGPLEKLYKKMSGKTRVRATEGRTHEEQAEWNLIHHFKVDPSVVAKHKAPAA